MKQQFAALLILGSLWGPSHAQKDFGPDLINACMRESLQACKMTNKSVDASSLKDYAKALNCAKYGSTSGDNFNIGVNIEGIPIGLDMGSTSRYSSQVCKEEVKKLDTVKFAKQFSEVFSQECGATMSGVVQQCLVTAEKMANPVGPQSLQCNGVQSPRSITITTRYQPAAGEAPSSYEVNSVEGIPGMACSKPKYPGISQFGAFSCQLPEKYASADITMSLKNGVSCRFATRADIQSDLDNARKYSCSSLPSVAPQLGVSALDIAIAGTCSACMKRNLATGDSDGRSLQTRFEGCAVWAFVAATKATASMCNIIPIPAVGIAGGPMGFPGFANPLIGAGPSGPPLQPTANGTTRGEVGFLSGINANTDVLQRSASALCNGRAEGSVLELQGTAWSKPPVDFLSDPEAQAPNIKQFIQMVREGLK